MSQISHPKAVIFMLAIGAFAIGTAEFASMGLIPQFMHAFAVSPTAAGYLISLYALGVVVGAPTLAVLLSNWPRRRTLIFLMAIYLAANAVIMLTPNFHVMLIARFVAGLPHGAFFGIGALLVSGLVEKEQRGKAVASMMVGLSVATIVGTPIVNWLGLALSWRLCYLLVVICAAACITGLVLLIPADYRQAHSNPLNELAALKNPHIWMTLATAAIGIGGIFAVYTYLGSLLITVTGISPAHIPFVFFVLGLGIFCGNLFAGAGADISVKGTIYAMLISSFVFMLTLKFVEHNVWLMGFWVFMIGITGGFGTVMQIHLMNVAGKGQNIAAALNHSAFNFANALGPFLAGITVKAGWGYISSSFVGATLALGGIIIWTLALYVEKKYPLPDTAGNA